MIVQSTAQPTGGEGPFNQVTSKTVTASGEDGLIIQRPVTFAITAEISFFMHYIDDNDLYLHRAA